ncbi:MAG: hypothetical protein M1822_000426 [Bathelium mastoideum]|nr:MAG: hypothetical protein M1822_000426 [Bathelium mastoideum]
MPATGEELEALLKRLLQLLESAQKPSKNAKKDDPRDREVLHHSSKLEDARKILMEKCEKLQPPTERKCNAHIGHKLLVTRMYFEGLIKALGDKEELVNSAKRLSEDVQSLGKQFQALPKPETEVQKANPLPLGIIHRKMLKKEHDMAKLLTTPEIQGFIHPLCLRGYIPRRIRQPILNSGHIRNLKHSMPSISDRDQAMEPRLLIVLYLGHRILPHISNRGQLMCPRLLMIPNLGQHIQFQISNRGQFLLPGLKHGIPRDTKIRAQLTDRLLLAIRTLAHLTLPEISNKIGIRKQLQRRNPILNHGAPMFAMKPVRSMMLQPENLLLDRTGLGLTMRPDVLTIINLLNLCHSAQPHSTSLGGVKQSEIRMFVTQGLGK